MTARERILARLGSALGRSDASRIRPDAPAPAPRSIPDRESLTCCFEAAFERAGGIAHRARREEVGAVLARITTSEGSTFSAWETDLLASLGIVDVLRALGYRERSRSEASAFDVTLAVTEADAAVAETGSLLLVYGEGRARLPPALALVHVCIVPQERFVDRLEDCGPLLAGALAARRPAVIVTGQSASGDIEGILVRGAHGPLAVHALIVTEGPQPMTQPPQTL
jgi:L-lactate utilization protein LutC